MFGSDGVFGSNGVYRSDGVFGSSGVSESFGVINSNGVSNQLFLAGKKESYGIFGLDVSRDRYEQVFDVLKSKLNGWFPKFTNQYDLKEKYGAWKETPIQEILEYDKKQAWSTMPKEAIDYACLYRDWETDRKSVV